MMSYDNSPPHPSSHHMYPDEDTRPTSRQELAGFYLYGWASEVFVVCGMGSFIPMTLEQLARAHGVLLRDRTTPCQSSFSDNHAVTSSLTAITNSTSNSSHTLPRSINASSLHFPPKLAHWLLTRSIPQGSNSPHDTSNKSFAEAEQCIFSFFGRDINTASFAMYVFSISVLLQAVLIVSLSGAADHGRYRKSFLLTFGFVGATSMMMFLFTDAGPMLAALWSILANTCFGASFVLLNSFLPLLVRYHPEVLAEKKRKQCDSFSDGLDCDEQPSFTRHGIITRSFSGDSDASDSLPLVQQSRNVCTATAFNESTDTTSVVELNVSTRISAFGTGVGYTAAILVQLICILVIYIYRQAPSLYALRLSLFIIGLWWFFFTIPDTFLLRSRPGPPLNLPFVLSPYLRAASFKRRAIHFGRLVWSYLSVSWGNLFKTFYFARKLRDLLIFLFAWFLLSDGIATTSGTAILFAKTTIGMPNISVALISILSTIFGIFGSISWPRIAKAFNISTGRTILACNIIFLLIPIYGLLGLIPMVQRLGFFGLQTSVEMYILASLYGFQLGGLSSYCRAFYAEMIPPGSEAAFFALYAITDKGSSVLGPIVVGYITDKKGSIRSAFWFLAILVALPIPLLYTVNVERGRRQAWQGYSKGQCIGSADSNNGRIRMIDAECEANES